MEILTFEDLQTQMQALIQASDYEAALELATEQSTYFPERFPQTYFWRAAMAALSDQPDLALTLLAEILATGFWYNETLLRRSSALGSLQGLPSFEKLITTNRRQMEEDQSHLFPLITLRSQGCCQPGDAPCPLLLGLHSNGSHAQASVPFWQPAASAGWLVGVPQSTQAMWKGAYTWDDRETAEAEIQRHSAALVKSYSIDLQRLVLGGLVTGGETAARMAISGVLPAAGFIAIGSIGATTEYLDHWSALLEANQGRALRGYFLLGQEDVSDPEINILLLIDLFNQAGISCEWEEAPDFDQKTSREYNDSLLRGLDFITSNEQGNS